MPEKTVSTMPGSQYASLFYISDWQDFEYASSIKYVRVLSMLWFSYNNIIIIVTNIRITLEFLSARFVHPGAPQLTISSFSNTSYNIRIIKANKPLIFSFLTRVTS